MPPVRQVLEAAQKFLGSGYKSIGRSGDEVFRSSNGLRQFRIDSNSLAGTHDPWIPHVHFEVFTPGNTFRPYINNHVPFVE